MKKRAYIFGSISIVLFMVAIVMAVFLAKPGISPSSLVLGFLCVLTTALGLLLRILLDNLSASQEKKRNLAITRKNQESAEIEEAVREHKQKISTLEQEKATNTSEIQRLNDVVASIKAKHKIRSKQIENFEGSTEYFRISKFHVRFSFAFSIAACIGGFVLLSIAVSLAMANQDFKSALIPTIGATIAEFIAATVFWVHRKSAEQLNRYYDSLHEIEVFLSTMDVIDQISSENRDAAYQKVLDELFNIQKIKAEKEN